MLAMMIIVTSTPKISETREELEASPWMRAESSGDGVAIFQTRFQFTDQSRVVSIFDRSATAEMLR